MGELYCTIFQLINFGAVAGDRFRYQDLNHRLVHLLSVASAYEDTDPLMVVLLVSACAGAGNPMNEFC